MIAVLAVGLTAAARWGLAGSLGERALCLSFLPAILLSAYIGGLGPGVLATVLGLVSIDLLGMHWSSGFAQMSIPEAVQYTLFVSTCLFICGVAEGQRRALRSHQTEIVVRERSEQRLTAEHAVTRILADASSLEDAAPTILHAVRESLRAPAGLLWLPDASRKVLQCSVVDMTDDARVQQFGSRCREFTFAPGIGLPGRVWDSDAPAWIVDVVSDTNFPRARIAADAGICTGMAFPLRSGGEFFGVIEFFTDEPAKPDLGMLNMMNAIGSEIGQFILRRRAEQRLRRSQHDLADLVETATIGLHWVSKEGKILWANKSELEMLGYSGDEYVGHHIGEFHVEPEAVGQLMDCLKQGRTVQDLSARMRCRDGTIKHVMIDSNVLFEDGRFIHTRSFTRDVTEQKRAEEALRQSEQSLRLALEAGRMGTWEWEIAAGKVAWSASLEKIHGLAPGTFPGTFEAFLADMYPEDRPRIQEQIQETVKQRKDHLIEYRLVRADGQVRWVEGRGKLVLDSAGHPVKMVGVCLDITERKQAEQERSELLARERQARAEAERASRAKDEFLAVLSHELRTPLTPVLLTVTLLESSTQLTADQRRDLQTIRRNVELEARLIDDLLDLTRIARGKLQLELQMTDVHLLVRSALDICHRTDGIRLIVDLSAARHHARADPARLQQVFWNVLNNAHKFTPNNGTITVRSRNSDDGRIVVEVIDTGVGIDSQSLPRIFDAFEQGHAQSRRFGGLGLGLAISRALVEAQGGVLRAHSDGRGRGATFAVELPAVRAPSPRPSNDSANDEPDHRWSRPLRILVVEDHEPTRSVMTKLLRDLGHRPMPAGGVESALKLVLEQPIDLVISDLGLPDGSGHDLMRQIRRRFDVRGIALSGYGMEDDLRRSEEAGFAEHLIKPIDVTRLQAAIRRVTDQPAVA